MEEKRKKKILIIEAVMIVLAIAFLLPLILVFTNSFKSYNEILTDVIKLPSSLQFSNYANAFEIMNYPRAFLNTVFVTVVGTLGIVLFSAMAGFKLSRTKTKYSWLIFLLCISPMMIPFQSFMITLTQICKKLNLMNSLGGLAVVYWGLGAPLSIFLYHGFAKTIPRELDECAQIDGCSSFRMFFSIILPILKPVTSTVVVINVMWIWNDFLLPLLMINGNKDIKTLQLAAYNFFGQYVSQWHYALAAVVLTVVPAIIFFILMQKQIIEGMTSGAVKG